MAREYQLAIRLSDKDVERIKAIAVLLRTGDNLGGTVREIIHGTHTLLVKTGKLQPIQDDRVNILQVLQ